jgi:sphinganine C4-monooxygenase
MTGNQGHDIMIWASRVHNSGQTILTLLSSSGLNVKTFIATLSRSVFVTTSFESGRVENEVELLMAKLIYYGLMPVLRFYMALWVADTWVFFIHRAEHSNQWLYSK